MKTIYIGDKFIGDKNSCNDKISQILCDVWTDTLNYYFKVIKAENGSFIVNYANYCEIHPENINDYEKCEWQSFGWGIVSDDNVKIFSKDNQYYWIRNYKDNKRHGVWISNIMGLHTIKYFDDDVIINNIDIDVNDKKVIVEYIKNDESHQHKIYDNDKHEYLFVKE